MIINAYLLSPPLADMVKNDQKHTPQWKWSDDPLNRTNITELTIGHVDIVTESSGCGAAHIGFEVDQMHRCVRLFLVSAKHISYGGPALTFGCSMILILPTIGGVTT